MYSVCKLSHPATGIEHSLTCYFFNRSEKSLVVAGANVIRVFKFMPDIDVNKRHAYSDRSPPKMRLECVASYTLFGNIMSMQSVSFIGSTRDSLLLSFKDAKLSIVEYDLDTNSLHTVSLHYFEDEDIQAGWTQHYHVPYVRVDPEGRCAVMLVYGRKLVVLPFRRENPIDDPMAPPPLSDPVAAASTTPNRPPVLTSYMIVLKDIEEKMENIKDVQFLHGYNEPTLLILYEPMQTFPGRIAVRRDTCCMVAISLNMDQKVHPVIWSVNNLPMDCTTLVPVAKPLAGTLVIAHSALIYLNQSVPPYGVSLNSITDVSTGFPLKVQEGVKMNLEGVQVCFLAHDRLVMSLKGGELYVLTLFADTMRSIRSFNFQKAAASVLTTSMALCEEKFLFLGSRLGNSLLLKLTEKETADIKPQAVITIDLCQPGKRRKMEVITLGDCMASDVTEIRDEDELEVYGNEVQASVQLSSYSFEVCDSLLNIGPCGNVSMGEPAFLSEEFNSNPNPDIELVTSSGYGKNGALCVLQRSIRPQVATTFELHGCINMWTVFGSKHEVIGDTKEITHAFMILSQKEATMILQTGKEINELDHSGFNTREPTIFSGNIGNNKYIVQVSTMGVRLLHGSESIQHLPIDLGSPLVTACTADPFVMCLSGDGQLILLTYKETRSAGKPLIQLTAVKPKIVSRPKVTNICLYRDISGMFSITAEELESETYTLPSKYIIDAVKTESIDDEEELLYGEASALNIKKEADLGLGSGAGIVNSKPAWWRKHLADTKVSYWALLTRENGLLEIYSLPEMKLSYVVPDIGLGNHILTDSLAVPPTAAQGVEDSAPTAEPKVKEILLVGLGQNGSRPLLFVRLDSEVIVYQAYSYPHVSLNLRFSRIGVLLVKEVNVTPDSDPDPEEVRVNQLRFFSNISGYCGVFVCGNNPHWIFLTGRGELRMHPMNIDGPVTSFAAFHNVNCPQGFLYFNKKNELRICVLPTHLSYDAAWPVRKVPLRCTVHFVTYHLESKTYCIVTSVAEPTKQYYKFNGEDKELSVEDSKDERFPFPLSEKFSISLFSPVSWEIIPNTKMDLDDWEHVTCLKNVSLAYEGTRSGFKGYISLGTNYNYSEDITSRGRIWLFDIIDVVPEPGQPLTKNRIKMVYNKDQKGPITAITHVVGFLVSAVGQKIYIWQLKDNDLVGVAFIDTQVYIHQLLSIKNLILVADVYKSIVLLRFQEEYRTLSLVSRDFRPTEVYAIDFLIDNTTLGFLVSDREKNIILYMYQPLALESFGGQKLIRKADIHLGQHINSFFRIKCRTSDIDPEKKHLAGADKRHVTMFATLDGAIGYLLPVPEKTYRRLLMLQNLLVSYIPHIAGLNPKGYRLYKSAVRLIGNPVRCTIDGELVWMFLNLSATERAEIAKKIGTKVPEILEDLMDIEMLSANF